MIKANLMTVQKTIKINEFLTVENSFKGQVSLSWWWSAHNSHTQFWEEFEYSMKAKVIMQYDIMVYSKT